MNEFPKDEEGTSVPASDVSHLTFNVVEPPMETTLSIWTALQIPPGTFTGTLCVVVPPGPTAVRMSASLFGRYGEKVSVTVPDTFGVQFVFGAQVLAPVHEGAPPEFCIGSPK
jgi:hypothetical protein